MPKVFNINAIKAALGSEMCTQLLVLHSFTGCDLTSLLYGIGKKTTFQKLMKGEEILKSCANTFTSIGKDQTGIETTGNKFMVALFDRKKHKILGSPAI